MDTWKISKWMSESAKKVFNAVTTGPSDAIKFGDKTQKREPWLDCNTHHRVQGWRTRSGSGNDSHALTDQIIVDVRLRDTEDGWSYNANYAQNHSVKLKLTDGNETIYSWEMSGIQDASTDDWVSSAPFLITKPGKWILYVDSVASQCSVPTGGFKEVGRFTALDPHEGCYEQYRDEGEVLGECGDCWENYTEDDSGACVADTDDNGGSGDDGSGGGYGGSGGGAEGPNMPLIVGGAVGLLLLIKLIKR